jgi:hypothetical protein
MVTRATVSSLDMRGTHPFRLSLPRLFLAALPLIAACGGASGKSPAAPSSAVQEPEPTTVEEAQAQLDRAKQQLGGAPAAGAAAADAPSRGESKTGASGATPNAESPPPSPCASPCHAIASMRRAVSAICRIAGDADILCEGAKKTLADSESRVKTCGC